MLLDSSGGLHGTVGGGCGEAEVYELAQLMLRSRDSVKGYLCHVDLTEDPDDGGDKVCGGRFDVLLTRWDTPEEASLLGQAVEAIESGARIHLETAWDEVVPGFWRSGDSHEARPIEPRVFWAESRSEEPSLVQAHQGELRFTEPLGGQLRLVIVGAGHIARPLCRLASEVGYEVWVLDDRAEYAKIEFFPEARTVVAGEYAAELPPLANHPGTSVVLVTRGHKHDQDCLRLMAQKSLLYLGMIGSQRRIEAVFAELREEGIPAEALGRVHAPIGLEIGARTPAEIAVSILAQMIMRRRLPGLPARATIVRRR